jgi:hypothetical protein
VLSDPRKFFVLHRYTGQSTCRRELVNFGEIDPRFWSAPTDFTHLKTRLRFHVPKKGLPRDIDTAVGTVWVVSDRAKAVLLNICPEDVDFQLAETKFAHEGNFGDYWVCITRTYLDALDEARSEVKIEIGEDGRRRHQMVGSFSAVFKPDVVCHHHLFRLSTCIYQLFCTETLRLAVKQAKLTGQSFLPAYEPRFEVVGSIETVKRYGRLIHGEIAPEGGGPSIIYSDHSFPSEQFEPQVGQRVEVSARIQRYGGRVADSIRVV